MPIYTSEIKKNITPQFLADICRDYGLPELKGKMSSMPTGWQNATFQFRAGTEDYVLRIYRHRARKKGGILHELAVLNDLSTKGFPVAPAIKDVHGNVVKKRKLGDIWFYTAVFSYLKGKFIYELREPRISACGRLLAKLHVVLEQHPKSEFTRYWRYNDVVRKTHDNLNQALANDEWRYPDLIDDDVFYAQFQSDFKFFDHLKHRHKAYFKEYALIHGDFHQGNLRFTGNKIAGVFDFDTLTKAPRVVDIARTIEQIRLKQSGFTSNPKSEEIERLIVKSYETITPLTAEEKVLLNPLVRLLLWKEVIWLLCDPVDSPQAIYSFRETFGRCLWGIKQLASDAANSV